MEVANGDNWERWKEGNSRDFVVETKRFTQKLTAGFWVIKEYHWSGIREISISASHVNWLRDRLKWKCVNPDSSNRKVWRKIGDCTVAVFDKANQWGKYISIVSKDPVKGNQFIIVPGGSAGSHWEQFAGWIGLASHGEIVNQVQSNYGGTEELVVTGARSYANVVTGASSLPGVSTFARLECEIAELRTKIMELTTAVRHLVDKDHQRRAVFGESSSSGTTLVENTINGPSEIVPVAITMRREGETNLGDGFFRAGVIHNQIRNQDIDSAISTEGNCDVRVNASDGGFSAEKMMDSNHLTDNSDVLPPQQLCTRKETIVFPQNHAAEENLSGSSVKVVGDDVIVSTGDVGLLVECGVRDVNSNTNTGGQVVDDCDVGDGNRIMSTCVKETAIVEPVTGDNFTLTVDEPVIPDTVSSAWKVAPNGTGLFRQKTVRSRWQRALQRISKRNEEQLVLAWQEVTEASRAGNKRVAPDVQEGSSIPSVVHLFEDECGDFIAPFMHTDVPGITDAIRDEQDHDISNGIKAGYPEFLARLEVGADSLAQWLSKINGFILDQPKSEIKSLGKNFFMEGISLHGLTFWTALFSTTEIRTSGKLLRCWKKLIGNPLLSFLSENGMVTDAQWLEVGPPILPEFGIAA